jgi:hypothetical protein
MKEQHKLNWLTFGVGVFVGLSINLSQQIIYSTQSSSPKIIEPNSNPVSTSQGVAPTPIASAPIVENPAPLIAATADIRIEYTGNVGVNCRGHYSVGIPDREGRSELHDIDINLPYTVKLKVRADAYITAHCVTLGNQNLKIKIFRNGVECKYDNIKGYEPGKVCSAPL